MDVISSKPPVLLENSTLGRNEPKTLSFSTTSELDANGFPTNRTLSSPTSPIEKPRISIPSPSYDRNPDYLPKSWYAQSYRRNSSSSFGDSPTFHTSSPLTASPLSTHLADNGSNTLTNGSKHTAADHLTKNQYNKENIHQLEQNQFLHLEEVLNMCSDYEKQIQTERLNKPQQNRIKTNGSLPRDKKLGSTPDGSPVSPCSPFHRQSPDFLENPTSPSTLSDSVFLESNFIPGSPRTRIRTIPSPIEHYRDYDTLDDFSSLTIKRTRRTNREANGHSDIVKRSPIRTINNSESNSSKNHLENSNGHKNSINNSQEINDKTVISSSCLNNLQNGCAPTKNGDNHSINTDKCDTLSTTYKILTNNVADIKKNELLSQKYIFPPTDWHASLYADPKMSTKKDIVQLKNEQSTLLVELSKLKSKLVDLHLQKEEINRELIMERALLDGELKSEMEMSREEEKKLFKIRETIRECDSQMENCTQKQLERQSLSKEQLGSHQSVLDKLKNQLQIISDEDLRLEIYDSIEKQSDLLETEHKLYEDIEFSLLEEEAGWLTKREELHREHSALVALYNERIARLESLRAQLEQISRNASDECIAIQGDINSCLLSIQQGHKRLDDINSSLEMLEKSYQTSTSNEELEKATEKQSQEDLDRISKITLDTPLLELNNVLMGRRTLASLQEIEKNRQIHLAKQGSIVIEEARKRVKELKQKVQNEVIAQWEDEQIKQRNLNHNSLNSIASEDYSNTESSELITTSVCSNYSEVTGLDSMSASQINISDTLAVGHEDGKKTDLENRALSNASFTSSDDVIGSVCFRNKSDNVTKRPLTRYLPVRNGELDLRAHIESAGHQIDACTHIEINNFSCRGYLSKLSVRFHRYSWKKRWFVFDRIKHTLSYYADRQEKKLRSVTYFQAIQEVYVDHMNSCKSPNPRQTFIVKTKERRYCLLAPTSQAVRIWVDVIFTGAEGYQEFTKV
ncbi:pleckstrin homology-like domain family B member 1 [Adelges cooleyi]|uniref:pleckstrin homology-like domain family B member 1 n=1 Tax=Adelges cooleyi TaxID=133065 RepID=UPI00217FC713|nr:pleckstrin homology-like domain family B member 1 [Adelges cooleyi]XP_050425693.1 pleckstrin homology-like domain family B member 1 [Adelges cooleyi]